MKEFKLRFTADVADIEAQFKGAASELKKFAAGVASAENQLEALQQTGAYLTQMDKQLSELKKKYPDIFKQIFGNVDAQMKAALEPLMKSPQMVAEAVKQIGNKLSDISSGKLEATNSEMKKFGETVQTLAKTMGMQADLDFLNGTDKARLKAQKLIDVLSNLAVAYYKLDKASEKTDLGSLVVKAEDEKPKNKPKKSNKKASTEPVKTEDSTSAPVVEHLKNINSELENQINELEEQRIRYQEIIDIITGENPDLRLKTTKKTDEQQLKNLVQQFNAATEAVQRFEAANDTSGDSYKKALGEQYRLATLIKNTMDYVSEKGSVKGADYVLSQVGSGVYDQAETIIDGLKTSVASSIQNVVQKEINSLNNGINKLKETVNEQPKEPTTNIEAESKVAEDAKLKAEENEKARLAAEAEAKAAKEAAEAAERKAEAEEKARQAIEESGNYDQGYFDAEKKFEQDRISYLSENNELQKKIESLEQRLAQSQLQSTSETITSDSSEISKYEELKQNLNDVIALINAKTDAFIKVGTTVDSVVSSEIISLDKLVEKLKEVLNNIQSISNSSLDINTENIKNEIDTLFSKLTDPSYKIEHLGLLNSRTGKVSSEYFEGTGNRAEGTFKNKTDYDTMFHNHPDVSTATASFGDWKAFLNEFDNFKKQIILTKDEIKTFDLSGLTKEGLKKIVDAIEEEVANAKKYDAEWRQDTEKYGMEEATQRWTQRRTESILANYPNVKISTKPVIENITEPNTSNTDSEIIQSEINFLSSLENKILDVKRAIEEKNKAFVNKGSTVDTVTMQEVSSLDKLLAKINEIKLSVDSKTQSIVNGANTIATNVNDIKTIKHTANSTKTVSTQTASNGIQDIDIERQIALIVKQEAQWKSTGQLTDELHQKIEKLSNDLLNLTNSSDLVTWRKQWMILKDEVTAAKYEIEATKKEQSQSEVSSKQYWNSAFKESLNSLITPEKRPELEQLKAYMLQQADQTKEAVSKRYEAIMTIISNKNATMQKLMSAKGENEKSYWQDQYSAWFGAWEALDENEIDAFFKDVGNAAIIGSDGIEKFNAQLELSKQLSGKQQDKQLAELNKLYEKQAQSVANQDKYNAQLQSSSVGNVQKDTIREKLKVEQEIEKELQKQIESYGSLYKESDRLTVIEKKRKEAAIEIQENASKEADKENKRLSNYGKATYTNATKKYENISDTVNSSDFISDDLLSVMNEYKEKYDELTAARQRFIDNPALANEESEQNAFRKAAIEVDKAREKVSLYIDDIKKYNEVMNNGSLKEDPITYNKDIDSVADAIKKYANNLFEGKLQVTGWNAAGNEMYGTLDKGKGVIENVTVALNRGTNQLYAYGKGTKEAGSMWQQFTGGIAKKSKEILTYLAGGGSIYQAISEIRKGVQYVKEIDSALTELKKVTDETDESYAQFLQTMSKTGAEIGATVSDLTNMAANWARLGYSMEEAGDLARSTAVLLNVSEFTDAEKASEALISTIQAYGYAAEDSMHVVDVLNEIGKIIACR